MKSLRMRTALVLSVMLLVCVSVVGLVTYNMAKIYIPTGSKVKNSHLLSMKLVIK